MSNDGFDDFDWENWGMEDGDGTAKVDGPTVADGASLNGNAAHAPGQDDENEQTQPGWVVAGGVVHWDESDRVEAPGNEADSVLAADDVILPDGAPDAPRVRAVHAWMARQRARELDALGGLLLTLRAEQHAQDEQQRPTRRRSARRDQEAAGPLELAIAEHQAASDEYSAQLERLDEFATHEGPGRALVEYYLWLTDYLATLATAADASTDAGPPHTRAGAAWRGRALAALAVRGRVERVAAPNAEED